MSSIGSSRAPSAPLAPSPDQDFCEPPSLERPGFVTIHEPGGKIEQGWPHAPPTPSPIRRPTLIESPDSSPIGVPGLLDDGVDFDRPQAPPMPSPIRKPWVMEPPPAPIDGADGSW